MKNGKRVLLLLLSVSLLPLLALSAKAAAPQAVFPVRIRVSGEAPTTAERYTVRLTALDAAPLPTSDGDHLDMVLTGSESAEFPAVVYDTVGIYRYEITLLNGEHSGAKYDASSYAVTVTVTNAENGGLEKTVVMRKDGKKQESAEFVVDYPAAPKPSSAPQLIKTGVQRLSVLLSGVTGSVLMGLGVLLLGRKSRE